MAENFTLSFNPEYRNLETKESECHSGLFKVQEPFFCLTLADFLCAQKSSSKDCTKEFLSQLRSELANLPFDEKDNDLYCFLQSDDLKNTKQTCINAIRSFFYTTVREWMSKVTGIELRPDYVALTASEYHCGQYLLCHDDELEERRVAFVLYLTPGWKTQHGGTLDLFSSDEHNEPREIVHSITPFFNSLSMFEVSQKSFHQVSEVLRDAEPRLSINGWYHGAPLPRSLPYKEPENGKRKPGFVSYETVVTWVNPEYLQESVQKEIREKFERDSEIELHNFLQENKYEEVMRKLMEDEGGKHWTTEHVVFNKRNYKKLVSDAADLPPSSPLVTCRELFSSEAMFLLLSQLTGLNFHPLCKEVESEADKETNGEEQSVSSQSKPCPPTVVVSQAPGSPKSERKRRRSATPDGPDVDGGSEGKRQRRGATRPGELVAEGETVLSPVDERGKTDLKSSCSLEYRMFEHGSYTLMHDREERDSESVREEFALDAQLFFTRDEWKPSHGGYTCYVAKGETEELLTVNPSGNSLALVYRDQETMRFVKYVNSSVAKKFKVARFCDLSASYYGS